MARIETIHLLHGNKPRFRSPVIRKPCIPGTCKNHEVLFTNQAQKLREAWRQKNSVQKESWISEFKVMTGRQKSTAAMNQGTWKYFQRPIIPLFPPKSQNVDIPDHHEHDILNRIVKSAQKQCYDFSRQEGSHKTAVTQTDYRDSEAQTIPWEPPYTIRPGHNPEVLTIAHLTWNHGLPAGIREVEIINRMRIKRAWEAILPPMDTPENIRIRTHIISALEVDEWAYREAEIQAIMDYRLELMEIITEAQEREQEKKVEDRLERLRTKLYKQREKEIDSIRNSLRRDLRKLRKKHVREKRPIKYDIIEEYADPTSELYAPQMRHGEHPKRRHEVIRKDVLNNASFDYKIDTAPNWLPTFEELKAIKPKPKPAELCIRTTRWTEENLKQLHEDLKAIRLNLRPEEPPSLMQRKYKAPPLPSTPCRHNEDSAEDTRLDQAATLIQKVIKGRAIQCMMYEGRNRCRELIEELQSTHALDERDKKIRYEEKLRLRELQRLQENRSVQEDRVREILNSLEGTTISTLLDFLSKELVRLEEERRVHALALLAEREKAKKEAEEAEKMEYERNRRREFDEMFKEVVKVHQDSVENYLEDILKEGIEWTSEEAAKEYIVDLCDKVDSVSNYEEENATKLEQEEMVASMIYNFVLPEVEKHNIRENIRERQQSFLRNAHEAIYQKILDLPPVEILKSTDELDDWRSEGESQEMCHSHENDDSKQSEVDMDKTDSREMLANSELLESEYVSPKISQKQ